MTPYWPTCSGLTRPRDALIRISRSQRTTREASLSTSERRRWKHCLRRKNWGRSFERINKNRLAINSTHGTVLTNFHRALRFFRRPTTAPVTTMQLLWFQTETRWMCARSLSVRISLSCSQSALMLLVCFNLACKVLFLMPFTTFWSSNCRHNRQVWEKL